jgi:ubiquinone/menaquinone biosynthesis C-methylase UbiE
VTRHSDVLAFFSQPERYLSARANIRIRGNAVRHFCAGRRFTTALDIGCGDGSLSIPLLDQLDRLTLLDLSAPMLAAAKERVPRDRADDVKLVDCDFMSAWFGGSFDLVLCMGVLAHVDDPARAVRKLCSLVAPSGTLLIQNSDAKHPIERLLRRYGSVRNRHGYATASYATAALATDLEEHGFRIIETYRYSPPLPGMARLLSDDALYRLTLAIFGDTSNRLASLGSECLLHVRRER